MLPKTKARRQREVTNSCLSCFETLTCIFKSSSVFCNTTRCGFVFGYLTHWEYAVRVCVFACIVLTNSPISWEVMYDFDHTFKGRNLTHTLLAGQRWSPGGQGRHMTSSQHGDIATAITHHFPLVLCHPFTYLFLNPLLCFQTLVCVLKTLL